MRRRPPSISDLDLNCGVCGHLLQWPETIADTDMVKCPRCGVPAGSFAGLKLMAADYIKRTDRRRTPRE